MLKKICRIITSIGIIIMLLPKRVFAFGEISKTNLSVRPINYIGGRAKLFVIPILALIIGLTNYFNKSKSSVKKKISIAISVVISVALITYVLASIVFYFMFLHIFDIV